MKTPPTVCWIPVTLALCPLLSSSSLAAVLTFDIAGSSNHQAIGQDYGDNITAFTSGGFSYGTDQGLTPNVSINYGDSNPSLWNSGYGDLQNVLFEDTDITGVLTITLTAEAGFEVILHSFDLAAYNPGFSSAPTINSIDVSDSSGSLLNIANATISETSHTTIDQQLQASELTITIDAKNLGSLNDDIAIDNIVISQVAIPEPSSSLLISFASFSLLLRRRRA